MSFRILKFILFYICINCVNYGKCIQTVDVSTSIGVVRGQRLTVLGTEIDQFLGIPYAEPPVGALRFAKPQPIVKPFEDVIDGTKPKNSCFQNTLIPIANLTESEDCLVLSIWGPSRGNGSSSTSALKPVMFWIYGGSFKTGSIFFPIVDGTVLSTRDIVFVSVNYRVGPFGWLYGGSESPAPGNQGLYDQLLALQWVRQNIHRFGGDPNRITIFGESAGSWSVSAHVLSPLSRGLFQRAILESGAVFGNKEVPDLTPDVALSQAKQMAKAFNCSDDSQWLDCLRHVDAKQLTKYMALKTNPIVGSQFLPLNAQNSFQTHNYSTGIDILAGVVRDEGSLLARMAYPKCKSLSSAADFTDLVKSVTIPRLDAQKITDFYTRGVNTSAPHELESAFWQFYGDVHIVCPTYLFAKQFAKWSPKKRVYFYDWTYVSHILAPMIGCTEEMGVCHASELEYVFGAPIVMNTTDRQFSDNVVTMWTNFAKNGNPTGDDKWPRLIESGAGEPVPKIKEINPSKPDHIIDDLFAKTCDGFWRDYFTWDQMRRYGEHSIPIEMINRLMG